MKNMKNIKKLNRIIVLCIVFTCCLYGTIFGAGTGVGDTAPGFSLPSLEGRIHQLGDYKGKKAVLLVFWATWCPNCKKEIPGLKKIHNEFSNKNLTILAVNAGVNDSKSKAKRYKEKYKLPYKVLFDKKQQAVKAYSVLGIPTVFIIDINGVIRYRAAALPKDLGAHFSSLVTQN
ncbi:MAG: TlpA family protein disulfide reductase [bacterium]|nr:TlpA family protein disulfide reductase [bacterium]